MDELKSDSEYLQSILNHIPYCTEATFKKVLLPLLRPEATMDDRNNWLKISGNGFLPVEVVDNKDHNKRLFIVPAIDHKPNVNEKAINMYETVHQLMRLNDVHVGKGAAFASAQFSDLITKAGLKPEIANQWSYIFEHYDVETGTSKEVAKNEDVSAMLDEDTWE